MATKRARARATILGLSALLWPAGPATADAAAQAVKGHCEIRFVGSSTLHDFSGEVQSRPFELETHLDDVAGDAWWSGAIEVAVFEMDTGIARRDRKMRAMFDAERFPLIVADFPKIESALLAMARSGGEPEIDFDLTIREAKRPVAARISHWTDQGRGARFDVAFELSLQSFGLEVPPVLGLLRVGDVVTVRVQVILDALAGEPHEQAVFDPPLEPLASGS